MNLSIPKKGLIALLCFHGPQSIAREGSNSPSTTETPVGAGSAPPTSPDSAEVISLPAKSKIKGNKPPRKPKNASESKKDSKPPVAKPIPATPLPVPVIEEGSHHSFGLIGAAYLMGSGFGLEYIYQPWATFDFGLTFVKSEASFNRKNESKSSNEVLNNSQTYFRASARYSYFRIVYFGLGVSMSSMSGNYGFEGSGVASGQIDSAYTARYVSPEAYLGSEWNFANNLYIGIDWVGFGMPSQISLELEDEDKLDLTSEVLTGSKSKDRVNDELQAQLKLYMLLLRGGYRF